MADGIKMGDPEADVEQRKAAYLLSLGLPLAFIEEH